MILSTSKRPSGRTRTFARELASVMPHTVYMQRGKKGIEGMAGESHYTGHERLCIILTRNGNPSGFEILDTRTHDYIGGVDFSVTLRREMNEGKIKPPPDDAEFFLVSEEKSSSLLATLLGVSLVREAGDAWFFATLTDGVLDFFRLDVGIHPVGPRLFVRDVYGKDHHRR